MTDFIADSVTHRIYCNSENEAHYLVGVLNSNVVNDAIKPYQTEGVYHGKRDIYRRPFEVCPIPQFDSGNSSHKEIAAQSKAAKEKLAKCAPQLTGSLAKVREHCRDLVRDEINEIDRQVSMLFNLISVKNSPKKQSAKNQTLFGLIHD